MYQCKWGGQRCNFRQHASKRPGCFNVQKFLNSCVYSQVSESVSTDMQSSHIMFGWPMAWRYNDKRFMLTRLFTDKTTLHPYSWSRFPALVAALFSLTQPKSHNSRIARMVGERRLLILLKFRKAWLWSLIILILSTSAKRSRAISLRWTILDHLLVPRRQQFRRGIPLSNPDFVFMLVTNMKLDGKHNGMINTKHGVSTSWKMPNRLLCSRVYPGTILTPTQRNRSGRSPPSLRFHRVTILRPALLQATQQAAQALLRIKNLISTLSLLK